MNIKPMVDMIGNIVSLDLTPEQNADRERLGACVVPGEPWDCPHDDRIHTHFSPPRQFSDAAAPCQTIDGIPIDPAVLAGVTETRGGKPIIEIRVPYVGSYYPPGHPWHISGPVVVARATVTLLPVVDGDWTKEDPRAWLYGGTVLIAASGEVPRWLPFDPLPVAGRDWVAVFSEVD